MGKKLTNEQDVQSTQKSFEVSSKILKFDENTKTPVYILDDGYEEGFVHWIDLPGGRRARVVCGGGMVGKGFDPTNCKICNHLVEGYREARSLEGEDAKEAEKMRKALNRMRANYSAEFLATKGELLTIKDPKTKKKSLSADFDEYEVGVLALTEAQFNNLIGLINSEKYPFMKSNADLLNRVLILDKRKRDKNGKEAKFASIEFTPLKNKSDAPEVEYDKDEFDTKKDFEVDEENIDKAFALLNGGEEYDEEVDEEIEYEDEDGEVIEDDEEEIIEDDDEEEYEDEESEDEESDEEENDLSDIEDEVEDDFEDDIPWEEDAEEKTPPKKTTTKKAPPKKTEVKKTKTRPAASKKTTAKKTTTKRRTKK